MPASLRALAVTFSKNDEYEALCGLCAGLVQAGLLRREIVDGRARYRQMHPQPFVPGDLVGS